MADDHRELEALAEEATGMLKTTYKRHRIEEDKHFDGQSWFYVYPEGAEDYGMDPLGEFGSLANAKDCVDIMITDREEWRQSMDFADEHYARQDAMDDSIHHHRRPL